MEIQDKTLSWKNTAAAERSLFRAARKNTKLGKNLFGMEKTTSGWKKNAVQLEKQSVGKKHDSCKKKKNAQSKKTNVGFGVEKTHRVLKSKPLKKDTFEPGAAVFPISEASSSKDTWGKVLSYVACYDASSVADSPTVTFCSVHIHDKVAKKRDASTSLLQRLRVHMILHFVDFIGGDFNMSAFSTVGAFFLRPGVRGSWQSSVAWTRLAGTARRPHHATASAHMVQSHGCYKT